MSGIMYNWGVVVLKLGFFEVVSPAPNLLLYPMYLGTYSPPNPSYYWRFLCWRWKIEIFSMEDTWAWLY